MDIKRPQAEMRDATEQRLHSALAEYKAKMAEMAELIARVRHEINNPLTGIIGQAQLLLRDELSDKVRRRVEIIEQLAGRIRDHVAQLRDVQHPQLASDYKSEPEKDDPPRH